MKIASVKYTPHELIFNNPFKTSRTKSNIRKVYFLHLETIGNKIYSGECAPLPEHGSEDYQSVENELKNISNLKDIPFPSSEKEIKNLLDDINTLPTIRFGLEQALFKTAIQNGFIPSSMVKSNSINCNAVIGIMNKHQTIAAVKKNIKNGFSTIKIKMGRSNFETDFEIANTLNDEFGDNVLFRYDINGKWTFEEALKNIDRLNHFNIQYIEQPVSKLEDLINLSNKVNIPLAADESVKNLDDINLLIRKSRVNYFVIKPMFWGGFYKTLELTNFLSKKNIVLSSALESNLGRQHLISIAASINSNFAHGLATSNLFLNDTYTDLFPITKGKIKFSIDKFKVK